MNPRYTDCETNALTTTLSRRLESKIAFFSSNLKFLCVKLISGRLRILGAWGKNSWGAPLATTKCRPFCFLFVESLLFWSSGAGQFIVNHGFGPELINEDPFVYLEIIAVLNGRHTWFCLKLGFQHKTYQRGLPFYILKITTIMKGLLAVYRSWLEERFFYSPWGETLKKRPKAALSPSSL